jgi:hypothetical protein
MTTNAKITWIDDDDDHVDITKNLHDKEPQLKIEFILADKKLSTRVEKCLKMATKRGPDLFLIDDKLPMHGFNRRGLSVGMQVRERLPEVPIYLFSAYRHGAGVFTTLAQAADRFADDVLDLDTVQTKGHKILYHDALDYRRIRNSDRKSVNTLFGLMAAPLCDQDSILDAFPINLRKGLAPRKTPKGHTGNSIEFGMWIRKTFLEFPGFVYDSLYSATKLGMTHKAFLHISLKFDPARYRGVFYESRDNRWWNSSLRELVVSTAKQRADDTTSNVQKLTQKVFKLRNTDIAKCVVCGEKYPDTVGLYKYDVNERKPVHFRCSVRHPWIPSLLHFDQIRQFDRR